MTPRQDHVTVLVFFTLWCQEGRKDTHRHGRCVYGVWEALGGKVGEREGSFQEKRKLKMQKGHSEEWTLKK